MAGQTVTEKLIASHLVEGASEGEREPGRRIGLKIDQTLTQDATGTIVLLALEAMDLGQVQTEASVQYVDHNLLQVDHKNPDDHLFLETACKRYGLWFSRAGNGVSHPVHMQHFGKPGRTLLGSDSHTCAAGSLGMLAIGAGGIDVAMAMAGEPYRLAMPEIWGIRLVGSLPEWVSAKDVILEMLRRHGVAGGLGRVIEYHGPGLDGLSAMDRHVIANMGAELGATTTVFPSDEATRQFLVREGREDDWQEIVADPDARYDVEDEIDLATLEPLIAKPSSPGNVVPVRELAGEPIYQSYIGSSANPGYRDFAIAARMMRDETVAPEVSFDVNPTSRQLLEALAREGLLGDLIHCGARLHQAGCNGCIGMGQAPAHGRNSLRTVPRNFPGRSGTAEDSVFLCSPETATASAITGRITDPRDLGMDYPIVREPDGWPTHPALLIPPLPEEEARKVEIVKGPNIGDFPELDPLPDRLDLPVLLVVGDDVSTDEILPAGAAVLPYRSNIPKIAEFAFGALDPSYPEKARETQEEGGHAVIGGKNYGQGSSREHAALAPRYLGLRAVISRSFARIHLANLVNFGVLPLTFGDPEDPEAFEPGARVVLDGLHEAFQPGKPLSAEIDGKSFRLEHGLSERQVEIIRAGGLIHWMRQERA